MKTSDFGYDSRILFAYFVRLRYNRPKRIGGTPYCIDVGKLAEKCGMEFAWVPEKLFLFGMIVFQ